jgi:hypothetical protein
MLPLRSIKLYQSRATLSCYQQLKQVYILQEGALLCPGSELAVFRPALRSLSLLGTHSTR